jgi:hypothetical protein
VVFFIASYRSATSITNAIFLVPRNSARRDFGIVCLKASYVSRIQRTSRSQIRSFNSITNLRGNINGGLIILPTLISTCFAFFSRKLLGVLWLVWRSPKRLVNPISLAVCYRPEPVPHSLSRSLDRLISRGPSRPDPR